MDSIIQKLDIRTYQYPADGKVFERLLGFPSFEAELRPQFVCSNFVHYSPNTCATVVGTQSNKKLKLQNENMA